MYKPIVLPSVFFICMLQFFSGQAQDAVEIKLIGIPEIVNMSGGKTVWYELQIRNATANNITLNAVSVFNPKDRAIFFYADKANLTRRFKIMDENSKTGSGIIAPGGNAIVYLEYASSKLKAGLRLQHVLSVSEQAAGRTVSFTITGAACKLSSLQPLILGNPLQGGDWVAMYDPSWERGHRRVIYTVEGQLHIPGLFCNRFYQG